MSAFPGGEAADLERQIRDYLANQPRLSALTVTADSDLTTRERIALMAKLTTWREQLTGPNAELRDLVATSFSCDQVGRVTTVWVLYAPELIDREAVLEFLCDTLSDIFVARRLSTRMVLMLGHILAAWPPKKPRITATDT
jgi:hypothetical protein